VLKDRTANDTVSGDSTEKYWTTSRARKSPREGGGGGRATGNAKLVIGGGGTTTKGKYGFFFVRQKHTFPP